MRISHLVPGSGGTFYCQNCLRDHVMVRALRRAGHDVMVLPLYLPRLGAEEVPEPASPVFFGGINVFLQQRFALFRATPRWIDRFLDAPWLLKLAATREGSTNAASLGPMTLSMLQGRDGCQKKELERLAAWLATQPKPDILHISNMLLIGLAPEIKRVLDVPIVCSLQDEEPWIEAMPHPWKERCWQAIATNAKHVDLFVATSAWYAARIRARVDIPHEKCAVVFPGVDTSQFEPGDRAVDPPAIGFIARISEALGFGAVVDAFIELRRRPGLERLRLRATGGHTPADRPFLEQVRARLRACGAEEDFELLPTFDAHERRAFLQSVSVLSVPVVGGEAFGLPLIEAMSCGVAVVQPRIGAYPEIIEATGGGILYEPDKPGALADALCSVLLDGDRARQLGQAGRAGVLATFAMEQTALQMLTLYESVGNRTKK